MDLDDLFEGKRHHGEHRHGKRHDGHRGHDARGHEVPERHGHDPCRREEQERPGAWDGHGGEHHRSSGHPELERALQFLSAHKALVVVGGLLLAALAGALLYLLLPVLASALGWVDQHGVKGAAERVWQGSGGR